MRPEEDRAVKKASTKYPSRSSDRGTLLRLVLRVHVARDTPTVSKPLFLSAPSSRTSSTKSNGAARIIVQPEPLTFRAPAV